MSLKLIPKSLFPILQHKLSPLQFSHQLLVPLLKLRNANIELLYMVSLRLHHRQRLIVSQLQIIPLKKLVLELCKSILIQQSCPLHLIQPLLQLHLQSLVLLVKHSHLVRQLLDTLLTTVFLSCQFLRQ